MPNFWLLSYYWSMWNSRTLLFFFSWPYYMAVGSWFPNQGLNLDPQRWKHRVQTPGSPGVPSNLLTQQFRKKHYSFKQIYLLDLVYVILNMPTTLFDYHSFFHCNGRNFLKKLFSFFLKCILQSFLWQRPVGAVASVFIWKYLYFDFILKVCQDS